MTFSVDPPLSSTDEGSRDVLTSFSDHKYLLLAMLVCLQSRLPERKAARPAKVGGLTTRRLLSDNLSEREATPCVVMRDSNAQGGPAVAPLALEYVNLNLQTLSQWMRRAVPPSQLPDEDTLHLALAPTLPGIPALFLSIGSNGENFSHTWHDGQWTKCHDSSFLVHAIHYANLVGTSIGLDSSQNVFTSFHELSPTSLESRENKRILKGQVCGFRQLAQTYDNVAVHSAIAEFRVF